MYKSPKIHTCTKIHFLLYKQHSPCPLYTANRSFCWGKHRYLLWESYERNERALSACVLACVCVCACARSQMHIFLSLQHTRLPLDFRQLAAKHTCLCQHDCTNTDKDSFSSIISFIGHNTYKRIDCPRNFVSKQTSCTTAINILYNLRVRSVFRSGRWADRHQITFISKASTLLGCGVGCH